MARAKWRVLTWSIVSTNFSSVTERTTAATTGTKTSAFAVSTVFLITRLLILHYCNYRNKYYNLFSIATGIAILVACLVLQVVLQYF